MNGKRRTDSAAYNGRVFSPPARVPDDINFRDSGPHLLTAASLTGTRVANLQDETLGTIRDMVLDLERGAIAFAVMASGGFMGVGERLFALDWKALTLDTERRCYVLDVHKTPFEDEPGFDKNGWPESLFRDGEA